MSARKSTCSRPTSGTWVMLHPLLLGAAGTMVAKEIGPGTPASSTWTEATRSRPRRERSPRSSSLSGSALRWVWTQRRPFSRLPPRRYWLRSGSQMRRWSPTVTQATVPLREISSPIWRRISWDREASSRSSSWEMISSGETRRRYSRCSLFCWLALSPPVLPYTLSISAILQEALVGKAHCADKWIQECGSEASTWDRNPNPKHQIRNQKQIPMIEISMTETPVTWLFLPAPLFVSSGHLDFEFVSDLDIRISDLSRRSPRE